MRYRFGHIIPSLCHHAVGAVDTTPRKPRGSRWRLLLSLLGSAVTCLLASGCATTTRLTGQFVDSATDERVRFSFRTGGEKLIALTLDDAPDPASTPALLDLLAAHDARATFFCFSEAAAAHPAITARILREGHEIGNHLDTADRDFRLSAAAWQERFDAAQTELSALGPVRWYRPGTGFWRGHMLAYVKDNYAADEMRLVLGMLFPWDTLHPWPAFSAWYIRLRAYPGAVIILHDGPTRGLRTADVLRDILPALTARGYRFVTLSELAAAEGRR